ncbi:MAG: gliding motility-associated C-terminal domain-containing protein [Bacteroidia bacterium]
MNQAKRLLFGFLTLLISLPGLAQKSQEGNIWYFGRNAGLDFKTGTPLSINNGQMNNLEGVASIANDSGQILFYSDGMEVYNKLHQLLNSGSDLNGHRSSTQSGVIVPQPVRGNRFFLFTVDEEGGELEYAILDSAGSGGTGSIYSRNHRLLNSADEKITAVLHANKTDIWIIGHEWGNNKFYAWLLTGAGLASSPVVTSIGPVHSGNTGYSKGYMKASPDGSQLALAVVGAQTGFNSTNNGRWELYDFNNKTGAVSNAKQFNNGNKPAAVNEYDGAYGVEFSPNGRFLYISCWDVRGSNDRIFQFDLRAGNRTFADINNSAYEVARAGNSSDFGALQLGPDGRIYIARNNRSSLSMIEFPNCPQSQCKYNSAGPSLGGNDSRYGLPTFIQTFFNEPEFDFGDSTGQGSGVCLGDSTQFWLLNYFDIDSIKWFFGDPGSGVNNTSTIVNPTHIFSTTGQFTVKAIIYRPANTLSCDLDTIEQVVTIIDVPHVDFGNDTILCEGQWIARSMQIFSQPYATYKWSTGSTGPAMQMTQPGTYWGRKTNEGCSTTDTITVDFVAYPDLNLPTDSFICLPDSIYLFPGAADSFLWSNGATDSFTYGRNSGALSVIAMNGNLCTSYDTIVLTTIADIGLDLDSLIEICIGDTVTLNAYKGSNYSYLWSTGSTDSAIIAYNTGFYDVVVYDTFCSYNDFSQLIVQQPANIDLGADTSLCTGDTYLLSPIVPNATYSWHDGSTDSTFMVSTAGLKKVDIVDGPCYISDSIMITYITLPIIDLGPDSTICEDEFIDYVLTPSPNWAYTWNGTIVADSLRVTNAGQYIVSVSDTPSSYCFITDTVVVTVQNKTPFSLGSDTTLCAGDSVILDVSSFPGLVSYSWFDFNNLSVRRNNPVLTEHWVALYDGVCTTTDSVTIDYYPTVITDVGPDLVICDNLDTSLLISVNIGTEYRWTNLGGTVLSNSRNLNINNSGTFIGTAGTALCKDSDTLTVINYNTPVFKLGADTTYCNSFSRLMQLPLGAQSYRWSTGSNLDTLTASSPALYWAHASNNRCIHRDSILIEQMETPVLDQLLEDQALCELQNFTLSFSEQAFTTYMWEDGSSLNPRVVRDVGNYWLRASNNCGTDSVGFSIAFATSGCRVDIPSAFSPNGDNTNEVFRVVGDALEFEDLEIYNRWGELIFKGDPLVGWDGTYKGEPVQQGIYIYLVSFKRTQDGYSHWFHEKGTVYLLR